MSTADFVPPSVYVGFRLFVLPKRRPARCLRFAGGQDGGLSPGRIDPTASRPTQPRPPSSPRRAPPRPDRPIVCPGFGFDKLFYRLVVEPKTWTPIGRDGGSGAGRGSAERSGAGRGGARRSGAERGRSGAGRNGAERTTRVGRVRTAQEGRQRVPSAGSLRKSPLEIIPGLAIAPRSVFRGQD